MELWKPASIGLKQTLHSQIGPFSLYVKRSADELYVAHQRHEADSLDGEPYKISRPLGNSELDASKFDWSRWIIGDKLDTVQLVPVMPDRPVVVKSEMPVKIPSGHQARFFISIPVWLKLTAACSDRLNICELPSVILSSMWFGDPTAGELCYTLRTRARRTLERDQARPYRALCPVTVKNESGSLLDFQRLCIRVEYLKIYQGDSQLCTNSVLIKYHNQDGTTEINYGCTEPDFEQNPVMLSDSRMPFRQSLLKRSFHFCWFL